MTGRIHSYQSMGTLDGPGIRFVLFLQGCPLRCACCHNPDTWEMSGGRLVEADEVWDRVLRCRPYFGERGGLTVSGGEPLMQPEFTAELFRRCRREGIHTCLDTSGVRLDDAVQELLDVTDLVLLDIKRATNAQYRDFAGCSLDAPMRFLEELERRSIPTWIRRVIIPGLTDGEDDLRQLAEISKLACVERVELLPFRKLCLEKYQSLGIPFPLADTDEPSDDDIRRLHEQMLSFQTN